MLLQRFTCVSSLRFSIFQCYFSPYFLPQIGEATFLASGEIPDIDVSFLVKDRAECVYGCMSAKVSRDLHLAHSLAERAYSERGCSSFQAFVVIHCERAPYTSTLPFKGLAFEWALAPVL